MDASNSKNLRLVCMTASIISSVTGFNAVAKVTIGNTQYEPVTAELVSKTTNAYGMLTYTYTSKELWSGSGDDYSGWYLMTTPPAPGGYRLYHQSFNIFGDRDCQEADRDITKETNNAFLPMVQAQPVGIHCKSFRSLHVEGTMMKRADDGVWWAFHLQGHSERHENAEVDVGSEGIRVRTKGAAATSKVTMVIRYVPIDFPTSVPKIPGRTPSDPE